MNLSLIIAAIQAGVAIYGAASGNTKAASVGSAIVGQAATLYTDVKDTLSTDDQATIDAELAAATTLMDTDVDALVAQAAKDA